MSNMVEGVLRILISIGAGSSTTSSIILKEEIGHAR